LRDGQCRYHEDSGNNTVKRRLLIVGYMHFMNE